MFGTRSSTVIDKLTQTVTNIATNISQSCEIISDQSQTVELNNSGLQLFGSSTVKQTTDISSSCFSDVNKQTQLQNAIIDAIKQTTTAEGVGLLGAFNSTTSVAETKLRQIVENSITMENIQKNYTSIRQKQAVAQNNYGVALFWRVTIEQGSTVFARSTVQLMESSGIFNSIRSHIDQDSAAKTTNPLDFIADIFKSMSSSATTMFIVFALIALVIVGVAFYVSYSSSRGFVETIGDLF